MPTTTAAPTNDTKIALLDAAEEIIAKHGFAGASLRAITSRAGTNLAAVNYHFGSKEELARAVIARYLGPVNAERIRLVDEAEQEAGDGEPSLESLVRAFVGPVVRFGGELPDRGRHFAQICGRAMTQPDPVLRESFLGELSETIRRFRSAFARALPELSRQELLWRMQFMVGGMAHTLAGTEVIEAVHGDMLDTRDLDGLVERMVRFFCAGLAAPQPVTHLSRPHLNLRPRRAAPRRTEHDDELFRPPPPETRLPEIRVPDICVLDPGDAVGGVCVGARRGAGPGARAARNLGDGSTRR